MPDYIIKKENPKEFESVIEPPILKRAKTPSRTKEPKVMKEKVFKIKDALFKSLRFQDKVKYNDQDGKYFNTDISKTFKDLCIKLGAYD